MTAIGAQRFQRQQRIYGRLLRLIALHGHWTGAYE